MVWDGVMGNRKTELRNLSAQRYIDQVLTPHAVPFIRRHGPGVTLQPRYARPHVARLTTQYLTRNNVDVIQWHAVSPDLNPIEHIWDELGRKAKANHQINNVGDLTRALQQEWQNLRNAQITRYVDAPLNHGMHSCQWWAHAVLNHLHTEE